MKHGAVMKKSIRFILTVLLFSIPVWAASPKLVRIKKVGQSPNVIALSPDNSKIYATSYLSDELLEISLTEKEVTRSLGVGSHPIGLAIADLGKTAIIACKDSNAITFVDLEAFRVVSDVKVTGQPNSVALSPRGYVAYVTAYGRSKEGLFYIIDVRDRSLRATIKLGSAPFALAVSPISEEVYVVMAGSNEVWVVDPEKRVVTNKIAVGEGPDGIAITPDGKKVFVANSRTGDISIIDVQTKIVQISIPVGKMPFGVEISHDGKRVFVANHDSNNIAVFPADLSTLEPKTFAVDRGPTDINIGSDDKTAYIVNELSNSIVILEIP
jgi:YVTN family beta-propeller protein